MKTFVLYIFFLTFGAHASAQNFQLHLIGSSNSENKVMDSLNYNSNHKNVKSITDEITAAAEKLSKMGYIENRMLGNSNENDTSYVAKFSLGERVKSIHIYIGKNPVLFDLIAISKTKDTITLPYRELETFLNQTLQKLEQKGFALAKLKLTTIQKKKKSIYADLHFEPGQQRQLNSIVVQHADGAKKNSFPEGHLAQINRKYHKIVFNQDIVHRIRDDFEKFRFVTQVRSPEILFTKDTTKVYVYLENRKSNTFDGFIGFSNDKNNSLVFNGYLDITIENTLRIGEQFSLYWKSDGNNQKTFKTGIDLPYLFKSPVGLKAQIHIFKQDSTYQNTRTAIDLGYFIDYNTRIYLGFQATESSDIQNKNNKTLSDYTNSFMTSNLEYSKLDYHNTTFPEKSKLSLNLGIGKRATNDLLNTLGTNKQYYVKLDVLHNFYLNPKNCININYHNYFLKSDTYIINELFRFGGGNSIRGFIENSLQANFMAAIQTEYRYVISPSLYIHSILDYGYYKDNTSNNKGNLEGLGIGFGLNTKNGLLKIAFANGSTENQGLKFHNTIVHIAYAILF